MNVLSATLKNDGEAEFMLCVFMKHMKELQKKSQEDAINRDAYFDAKGFEICALFSQYIFSLNFLKNRDILQLQNNNRNPNTKDRRSSNHDGNWLKGSKEPWEQEQSSWGEQAPAPGLRQHTQAQAALRPGWLSRGPGWLVFRCKNTHSSTQLEEKVFNVLITKKWHMFDAGAP